MPDLWMSLKPLVQRAALAAAPYGVCGFSPMCGQPHAKRAPRLCTRRRVDDRGDFEQLLDFRSAPPSKFKPVAVVKEVHQPPMADAVQGFPLPRTGVPPRFVRHAVTELNVITEPSFGAEFGSSFTSVMLAASAIH
jgi:hypothetical protein